MKKNPLTKRQAEFLNHIIAYVEACGHSPTIPDLLKAGAASSHQPAHRLVTILEEKGYITRKAGKARKSMIWPVGK